MRYRKNISTSHPEDDLVINLSVPSSLMVEEHIDEILEAIKQSKLVWIQAEKIKLYQELATLTPSVYKGPLEIDYPGTAVTFIRRFFIKDLVSVVAKGIIEGGGKIRKSLSLFGTSKDSAKFERLFKYFGIHYLSEGYGFIYAEQIGLIKNPITLMIAMNRVNFFLEEKMDEILRHMQKIIEVPRY